MSFENMNADQEGEKFEFKVLNPGDKYTTLSLTGNPIEITIKPGQRYITFGPDSGMSLEEYDKYFFIDGVHVDEKLRGQGVGTHFYEEALKLAYNEGKSGLISLKFKRNEGSGAIWKHFEEQNKTGQVEIGGDKYDVIYSG